MRRALVFVLALAGTAACSYIFELPSSSTLPLETDGGEDAAADALLDLGPIPEAAPPPPPFCQSQTAPSLYCQDFDSEPPPDLASIGPVQVTSGKLVLANAVARSAPRALLSTLRGPNASGAVTHALGTNPDGVTLAFEQLLSTWETAEAQLSAIVFENGPAKCTVRLDGIQTTWMLTQVCVENAVETARVTLDTASPIVRGRWQPFRIQIAFAPTTTVTLDIDGTRTSVAGVAPLQRAATSVVLGVSAVPNGSVTLFQDNVLVTSP